MPVGGTGFGGFTAPAKPTFAPFSISPPASQLDINEAAQSQFELNNPGIYNQSSGLNAGSNLTGDLSGGATPDFLRGNDFRSLGGGQDPTSFSNSTFFGPSTSQFSGGTPDPASQGLFTQNPDGSPAGQFLPGEGPGGPSQLLPGEGGGGGGGGGGIPDTGGGGGGGGGGGLPADAGGGGGSDGGGGGGGMGGAGGMSGTPIDIQTLGPGTTKPISGWVDQALTTGSGWVSSAENVATTAIKAAGTFGANLLGGWTSYFLRGFLIVAGVMIILVALAALMWQHGGKDVAQTVAKVAK